MDYGVLPVILCGGSGSRLWPLSTADRPKPFHPIAGDETLLQATVRRLRPSPAAPFLAPVIVCAAAHEDLVRAQLRAIGVRPAMVLVEAEPGGTALATACAVRAAMEIAPEAKVLIAPADHHISDAQAFAPPSWPPPGARATISCCSRPGRSLPRPATATCGEAGPCPAASTLSSGSSKSPRWRRRRP